MPKCALQPGKQRWTEPKGLSSVPRRYQRPLYPRAGTLRGSEDRLGIYISSKVEGVDVRFLVDTGSNITILSPALLERISAPRRPVLEDVENRMIMADGSAKPFHGKGTFELEIEGRRVLQEVWVADIGLEGILGTDFVRWYDFQIVAAPGGQLELFIPELKGGSVNGVKPAGGIELSNYPCLRVKVEDRVLALANSEVITAAKVLDKCDGGLEPTLDGDQVGGEPWLRPKNKDVRLAREPQPKVGEHQDQQRCLPLELEELLNRSTDDLDDKQVGVLTDLLHEHQDVVATSKNPFSGTSITQQRIVTGESKPIKQAPGKRPLHLKEKTEEEIEKMLAKGIVEPSSSPWSFPVVLVEKKME